VSEKPSNLSAFISENFGANATYVEALLTRYQADPKSVDESWQTYFADLLDGKSGAQQVPRPANAGCDSTGGNTSGSECVEAGDQGDDSARRLRSQTSHRPAKKIVENMEQSLTVPTATSFRDIPVKLLEENRRLINESLQESGRGKASFTHLIGWAIVQAAKKYPALNNGFGVVDGAPSKIQNPHINLGLAIDVEKKDGTRNLLVPNIKNCESMNFAEFFAAYNEQVKKARDGKLEIADFQGTTISLTNPGTIGTVASNPRLMSGQSAIIATGAIEYPGRVSGDDGRGSVTAWHQQDDYADQHVRPSRDPGRGKWTLPRAHSRASHRPARILQSDVYRPRDQLPAASMGSGLQPEPSWRRPL
jgi:2-oxoglutarate dehydrogenase E1 component